MSVLTSVEPADLSELPSGMTEVFVDNLSDNMNEIVRFKMHPEYDHLARSDLARRDTEWSQIFDLGDTTLIW